LADVPVVAPADNPTTEGKISLGRKLFFDKRLSADGSVSCATCHDPERSFADTRPLAIGVYGRVGKRHSPALVNRGLGRVHFWDGRAASLEAQALQPISDPNEMDLPIDEAVKKLDADQTYRAEFQMVFERPLSSDDLARALATYVRSIRSGDAPYDRFVAGDADALSDEQKRGQSVFNRSACGFCHREPTFTDERFWNTGIAWNPEAGSYTDDGRYAVSRNERERGSFKTPTLRDVSRTAPYMHDGSLASLADVIEFYNQGGRRNRNMQIVRPLNLSAEDKQALVRFLESLTGAVTGK
jgi:cytochrome c peroxidase